MTVLVITDSEKMQTWLSRNDLAQSHAADILDCSQATVSQIVNGNTEINPHIKLKMKRVDVFRLAQQRLNDKKSPSRCVKGDSTDVDFLEHVGVCVSCSHWVLAQV